ncbi:cellulose synthase-like protein H1 isoform X2 [Macadamia integrifolia]|uniref:cellulose synthase-like protein H1 isoform X2 n=1 Tax=Macadamia integrifolia TaxID=60698 RepID=UPI001C4FAD8E|nr:cellulose synthase-like protein H1 isoform X2 [Macadamia integrifolia]
MDNSLSLPLQERIGRKTTLKKAIELIIFFLLLALLSYRLLSFKNNSVTNGIVWYLAFLCELWFTFIWLLTINIKWNPLQYKTYPQHLLHQVLDLPPVDLFLTTADPVLEPPIITVNTVLSLLALDYPTHKLACYVSDDGASPLTFYALFQASIFAKLWVPFCKKYNVQVRAPFMYFSDEPNKAVGDLSPEFRLEWRKIKNEYVQLCHKIEEAVQKGVPCELTGEFAGFSGIERRNHAGIVKTRVSGVITNSPFMLNVDCDMFVNNPHVILHAMCIMLGLEKEIESGFVQYPQKFYGGLKDDPFGNQFDIANKYIMPGLLGLQGSIYVGTGCIFRRKAIYGLPPDEAETEGRNLDVLNGKSLEVLRRKFGDSIEFAESAAQILYGKNEGINHPPNLSSSIEAAIRVTNSVYESHTHWGTKVGWSYGSITEDMLTGMRIHAKGWRSIYSDLDPPAFLGRTPTSGPVIVTLMKRWATGFLEIMFSSRSPILVTFTAKLQFRQCLAYLSILLWGLYSLPEFCYAILPAYSIFTNTHFLPKVSEPAILIPGTLFIIFNLYNLLEYIQCNLSVRAWWNNQRMARITTSTAFLFGLLSVIPKLLGFSETVFEVTPKSQSISSPSCNGVGAADAESGWFAFDDSPVFVPAIALLFVNLIALIVSFFTGSWLCLGEIICSTWVVLSFLPFLKGLFRKGIYGIPSSTICKSTALALLFVHFSRKWGFKD